MSDDLRRYLELFETCHVAVLGYLARRASSGEDAADAFSEVFLVVWRRIDEVPDGDEARLWLFGIARHVLANARRSEQRRHRLVARLAATLPADAFVLAEPEHVALAPLRTALDRLRPDDAELIRLVAWESLTPSEAAQVLGIAPGLARVRLHRARGRLLHLLADADANDGDRHPAPRPALLHPIDKGVG